MTPVVALDSDFKPHAQVRIVGSNYTKDTWYAIRQASEAEETIEGGGEM